MKQPSLVAASAVIALCAMVLWWKLAEPSQPPVSQSPVPAATQAPPEPSAGAAGPAASARQGEMVYIHNGPEFTGDHRYDYAWAVLRDALEETAASYGPYRMEPAAPMAEDRQADEVERQTGKLTVIVRGGTLEYASRFEAIWIPIDKGLLGYRVFLIRKEMQPVLDGVKTLQDLSRFTIGQGSDWKDIDVLRANGLNVVPGGDYSGLFLMLANKRFDIFSRSVEEVLDEYSSHEKQLPDLAIEQGLLLDYPIARYFWFARSPEGRRLAQRVREGMLMMIADGSFDRIFTSWNQGLIERLHLPQRRLFILKNPTSPPEVPLEDKRFWYSPVTADAAAAGSPGGH